ncbi:TPA: hypothetical protein ACSQWB_001749 [Clostridium perfringens]
MKINYENKAMIKKIKKEYRNIKNDINDNSNLIMYITSLFMKYILEDIREIQNMRETINNKRYIYSILRVTVEQVIIYKFLMRNNADNEDLCNDFLGMNIDLVELEKSEKSELLILKDLRGNRTLLYKNVFKQMCEKFEDINNETSLYGMYSEMADFVHNAYYESIVSEYNSEKFSRDWFNTIILFILVDFWKSYDEIRKKLT